MRTTPPSELRSLGLWGTEFSRFVNTNTNYFRLATSGSLFVKSEDIFGTYEPKHDYDLLNLVIIGLGKEINENNVLLGILETILSEKLSGSTKESMLLEDYKLTKDYGEGVREMCNISEGFYDRGIAAGIAAGRAEGIAAGRAEEREDIIEMLKSGMSREEIMRRLGVE